MNELLLAIARAELGTKEVPGEANNPRILHYAKTSGLHWYQSDETSWCGVFMGFCLSQIPEFMRPDWPKERAATAREWLKYGVDVPMERAKPGDIVVFWRESKSSWKGHVAILHRIRFPTIYCIGGNQFNRVCIKEFQTQKILGVRRL